MTARQVPHVCTEEGGATGLPRTVFLPPRPLSRRAEREDTFAWAAVVGC